jgi:hypothetical protein
MPEETELLYFVLLVMPNADRSSTAQMDCGEAVIIGSVLTGSLRSDLGATLITTR